MISGEAHHCLFIIQRHHTAVQKMVSCIRHLVIQHGDIRTGFNVLLQKIREILTENHVARCDDHVLLFHPLQVVSVCQIVGDIGVVSLVPAVLLTVQKLKSSSLGVDVVLTSGAQMIDQGARILSADEHLDVVDATVAQIGDREINDPVPSEQGNRSCRAEILKAVDSDTSWS